MNTTPQVHLSAALLLVVGALALTGCGGASSSSARTATASRPAGSAATTASSGQGSSLSKSQLLTRADTICRGLNTELTAAKSSGTTAKDIARDVPHNIVLERATQAQLGKLQAPPALARDWQQVLDDRELLVDELIMLLKAAKHGDAPAIAKLTASKKRSHSALRTFATRIGFKNCSEVG